MARIVILTEGSTEPHHGKTAASILRYRGDEVVALIDSTAAGKTVGELLGVGGKTPIVASLDGIEADELMIGVAPTGLFFPESWRRIILDAIHRGLNVTNGTHTFLTEDEDFVRQATAKGVQLWDVRTPPPNIGCANDTAKDGKAIRVHSVGTDCAIGKMTVTIELDREMQRRSKRSKFLATGQTGIMVSGYGLPIDRIISDFVAGASERLIVENPDYDYLFVEGQGSLFHPLYSGVTLGLLHGCAPDLLILCDKTADKRIASGRRPKPPLSVARDYYTETANFMHPCAVVGIALNTWGVSDAEARRAIEQAENETGLPATDVIRYGCENLIEAILAAPRPCERSKTVAGSAR